MTPKVSVCIDVYNYAEYLPQAIESVLAQTLTDWELIVVDDCSPDSSFEIAQEYAGRDGRIRAVRNAANLGMVRNRNACLALARGEYVKFVHADDFLSSPDALSLMVERMERHPAASLVACAMQFVGADGALRGRSPSHFSDSRFLAGTTVITRCLYEQRNLIGGPSSALFRRAQSGRGFDERFFHAADLEMWCHLLEQGCFGWIDAPLVAYRWHPRQQTEKDKETLSQADDQRGLLDAYLSRPYVRLPSWVRECLRHDAVRQTVRRGRQIGQTDQAEAVLHEYGRGKYRTQALGSWVWRKAGKRLPGVREAMLPPAATGLTWGATPRRPKGVNVCGFLKGQYGIGESSRAFQQAVTATGLPTVQVNIDSREHRNREGDETRFSDSNPYGINLMTFSFDYARRFYRDQGRRFFDGRCNIAVWYWELEAFPARWHSNFDYYDEIWVPTEFCRASFAAVSPIPIHHIPYPLDPGDVPASDRARFSIAEDACAFLFNFDFFSTLARKNPLGLIAAFRQAFNPDEKAVLVLKSINSAQDAPGRDQVRRALDGLNVVWIEEHLSGAEMRTLFASVDCYASLHRSEGLGLGMAQAMSFGKPVIATGYSGNLEYMNADNSLLVTYDLVELPEDYGPWDKPPIYEKGHTWAEPDIAHAAEQMRWVFEHRDAASAMGARARIEVAATLDPARAQQQIRARVDEIYGPHGA